MEECRLLMPAKDLVGRIRLQETMPIACLSPDRVKYFSQPTSLTQLYRSLQSTNRESQTQVHEKVVWLEACLRNPKGIKDSSKNGQSTFQVLQWTVDALVPSKAFARTCQFDSDQPRKASAIDILKWQLMATAGIHLLSRLYESVPDIHTESLIPLISCLAMYTDSSDPWTSSSCQEAAQELMTECLGTTSMSTAKARGYLLSGLLQERVKPLFAKSQNPAITQQARKALHPLPGYADSSIEEADIKPWKFDHIYIITVFRWILHQIEPFLEDTWPLVIPPLLTIIDDETLDLKIKGLELLALLLQATPSSLLARTGLGEVFHDTLMPNLSYLPTLTPEADSLTLLSATYPGLLALVNVRYPASTQGRTAALDEILRVGVFKGYAQTGEFVKIGELLVREAAQLIKAMGIQSIRHLKNLVPLVVDILISPFAISYPPLLRASVLTLQTVVLNCWPRIRYYRGEVLKGLTFCWIQISEEGSHSGELAEVKSLLQQSLRLMLASLQDSELVREIESVILGDTRLSGLLQT